MNKKIQYNNEFLIFTNYKEPLVEIKPGLGFGYYGALLVTEDKTKLQCHICGKLFADVGTHARQAHKISVIEYREQFKLAKKTALLSEKERNARKQRFIDYLGTLSKEELERRKQKAIENWKHKGSYQPKISLETKNKRGSCPDQCLAKIKEVADKIGKVPSLNEFVKVCKTQKYKHWIIDTFGSWNEALKLLNYDVKEKDGLSNGRKYRDEELLGYLYSYYKMNKKVPTATDWKRNLLPSKGTYIRHFGSINKARELADIPYWIGNKLTYHHIKK